MDYLNRMIAPLVKYHRAIGILLCCYWGALFLGTHIPLPQLNDLPKHSDKGMHFVAYAGLSFILLIWSSTLRKVRFRHYLIIFAITACYGATDELLQPFVGRTCDLYDWIADCIGSVIGLSIAALLCKVLTRYWKPAEFGGSV